MANSIISVTSQPDLNALISATKFGFLSKKKSMSIEVPTTEVTAVTAKLIEKDIDHQIWSIGPYGKLIFQETIDLHPKPRGRNSARNPIKYSAFGESKSIKDWIFDSRCLVSESTVRLRVTAGWDFTDAITNRNRRYVPPITPPLSVPRYAAFGVSRTLSEWARSPLCVVTRSTLRNRVGAGWSMEKALRTPYRVPKIKIEDNPNAQIHRPWQADRVQENYSSRGKV